MICEASWSVNYFKRIFDLTYRHQIPVNPSKKSLVRRLIDLNDFSLGLLESLESFVCIVRVFENVLVEAALSDGIRQRLWERFLGLWVERVLFWIYARRHGGNGNGKRFQVA